MEILQFSRYNLVEPVARIGDPESHTVELLNVDSLKCKNLSDRDTFSCSNTI